MVITDRAERFRMRALPNSEKKIMNKAEIFITRLLPTRVKASRPEFSLYNQTRTISW
jgi:hypothetical protein